MIHEIYGELKKIPFVIGLFYIAQNGTLLDKNINVISLENFNDINGLDIKDTRVITAITFQELCMPLAYWQLIKIENDPTNTYPENYVISYYQPIKSLEFPGYFIIPYFSNYVISKTGIVIKKSNGEQIHASRGILGYWTYRLTNDFNKTQNFLRHRILAYAFLSLPADFETLTINHKNGIKGDDFLDNLEWATSSENNSHAVELGMRSKERKIEMFDRAKSRSYLFGTLALAIKFTGLTASQLIRRASTYGRKVFDGCQYRFYDVKEHEWPAINEGYYELIFPDGKIRESGAIEAAKIMGVTRTSLMRLLREGRCTSFNGVTIRKKNQSPLTE